MASRRIGRTPAASADQRPDRSGPYGLRGSLRPTSSTYGTSYDLRAPTYRR